MLLFVFGVLFLKNLRSDISDHSHDNHDEIGHIHFYHAKETDQKYFIDEIKVVDSQQQANKNDENCSSGKSVFSYSLVPMEACEITAPVYTLVFELIFTIKNNFLIPYLEPRRKPPRAV